MMYKWELPSSEDWHLMEQELFSLSVYEKSQCLSVYHLHIYRDLTLALQFFLHIVLEWHFCRWTNLSGGNWWAKNKDPVITYIQSKLDTHTHMQKRCNHSVQYAVDADYSPKYKHLMQFYTMWYLLWSTTVSSEQHMSLHWQELPVPHLQCLLPN